MAQLNLLFESLKCIVISLYFMLKEYYHECKEQKINRICDSWCHSRQCHRQASTESLNWNLKLGGGSVLPSNEAVWHRVLLVKSKHNAKKELKAQDDFSTCHGKHRQRQLFTTTGRLQYFSYKCFKCKFNTSCQECNKLYHQHHIINTKGETFQV